MKNKIKVAMLILVGAVFVGGAGYGVGRAQEDLRKPVGDVENFRYAMGSSDFGADGDYEKLAGIIDNFSKSPALTKEAVRYALIDERKGKGNRTDSVLIVQNAQIIEQNKQMIALLTKIAAKK